VVRNVLMTTDLDIYRTAKVLIDRYGDGASLHAANRADELLDRGDMEGRAVWAPTHDAVLELLKGAPGEGEAADRRRPPLRSAPLPHKISAGSGNKAWPMLILRRLLAYAARRVASDPRVQAKAAELYEAEVKPRAEAAWRNTKANLDFAKSELRDVAGETDPLKNPKEFMSKAKKRLLDRD
jgi:hypothetical protein